MIDGNIGGIDFDDAPRGGKKEMPVFAANACGKAAAVALPALHAVFFVIGETMQCIGFTGRQVFQFFFPDSENTVVTAHPQVSQIILQYLMDNVVKESVVGGKRGKGVIFHTVQSAAVGTYPEDAPFVFVDAANHIGGESVARGVNGKCILARQPTVQAVIGTNPQVSGAVGVNGADEWVGQSVFLSIDGKLSVGGIQAVQAAHGAYPDIAVTIAADTFDKVVGETVFCGIGFKSAGFR